MKIKGLIGSSSCPYTGTASRGYRRISTYSEENGHLPGEGMYGLEGPGDPGEPGVGDHAGEYPGLKPLASEAALGENPAAPGVIPLPEGRNGKTRGHHIGKWTSLCPMNLHYGLRNMVSSIECQYKGGPLKWCQWSIQI